MQWMIPIALILFICSTTPITVALFLTSALAFIINGIPIDALGEVIFTKINSYSLLAVLFFILSGKIMTVGKTAEEIVKVINSLIGFIPGGLAIVTVFSCGVFAAISGSSPATVIAIGSFMLPAMEAKNYDKSFSAGLIASSGSLGVLIPPSIPMIIYATLVSVSVGKLFLAGILPGLMLILSFSLYSLLITKRKKVVVRTKLEFRLIVNSLKTGIWALMLPIIILGGIYGGIFTATEASAVSVFAAVVIEIFIYRSIKLKTFPSLIVEAGIQTASLAIIVSSASAFSEYLTFEMIPEQLAEFLVASIDSKIMFLLVINLALLVVGTFMDIISAMIILIPILAAALTRFEISPIHFAIIFIFNMEIGYLTPPLGVNLFVVGPMAKMPFSKVVKAVFPFIIIMLLNLILFTYIPEISLFLPNLIMGK